MSLHPNSFDLPASRFDDLRARNLAERWCALADRRLSYLTDMFESGRWSRYYTEAEFLDNVEEARDSVIRWRAIANGEFVAPAMRAPPQARQPRRRPLQSRPVQVQPVQTQSVQAQPVQAESVQARPVEAPQVHVPPIEAPLAPVMPPRMKPAQIKPAQSRPAEAASIRQEPARMLPVHTVSIPALPVHTRPAPALPVHTPPPVQAAPAQARPAWIQRAKVQPQSAKVLPDMALPTHVQPAATDAAGPDQRMVRHDVSRHLPQLVAADIKLPDFSQVPEPKKVQSAPVRAPQLVDWSHPMDLDAVRDRYPVLRSAM